MGDRANIYLVDEPYPYGSEAKEETTGIYLYTHWSGYRWPEAARKAIAAAKGRWGDSMYFNRIVIQSVFDDIRDDTTGGGVGTQIGDNEYSITVVDGHNQIVAFAPEGQERFRSKWQHAVPFSKYVLSEVDYPKGMDE